MDKVKGIAKGGWKPANDRPIHRETWKSDLKGIATGKKKDPYEQARNHESRPLSSLKDPDSFGPPPKHRDYYPGDSPASASPSQPSGPAGGLGGPVPVPRRPQEQEQVQEEPLKPPQPYRVDTSGLRTDHLPKPPLRREGASSPASSASPILPPRHTNTPPLPPRQATGPPPVLPPRMNEHPTESTPPPPPSYGEAIKSPPNPALINQAAATRLGQAGISVPGFGIGGQSASSRTPPAQSPAGPSGSQLSELQQRFARMNHGSQNDASPPLSPAAAVPSGKKPPPPPPPKKVGLGAGSQPETGDSSAPAPPPVPWSSKPRPG
jgi:hypothetical protein